MYSRYVVYLVGLQRAVSQCIPGMQSVWWDNVFQVCSLSGGSSKSCKSVYSRYVVLSGGSSRSCKSMYSRYVVYLVGQCIPGM